MVSNLKKYNLKFIVEPSVLSNQSRITGRGMCTVYYQCTYMMAHFQSDWEVWGGYVYKYMVV